MESELIHIIQQSDALRGRVEAMLVWSMYDGVDKEHLVHFQVCVPRTPPHVLGFQGFGGVGCRVPTRALP
eukprot:8788979-Pyramimonas_sp.AAC.1